MSRVFRCAVWTLAAFMLVSSVSCSSGKRARSSYDTKRYITEHDLRNLSKSNIPLVVNERVVAWMEYFTGAGRRHFKRYLERSSRYLPLMKTILQQEGMPTDLVYIALIESGFNNHAYSRAAAVGPWQFIGSTGRMYGLKQDGWVDERRDPVRATYAAAKLFRDLYNDYGDWYLAMVGYNAGPGRVKKAMQITGSKDFWVWADHRKALRAETRDYVPKYIAANIIARYPEKFGFHKLDYQDAWEHESEVVETQTDLSVVAKCAGVDEQTVFDLNPHLVRGATPPGEKNYRVRLPKGTKQKFRLAYAKIPKEERIQIVRHKVRRGDTLYKVARKYGVSKTALARANGLSTRARLHRGKTLVIPVGSKAMYAKFGGGGSSSKNSKLIRYKVKRGDTLSTIARKYSGVTVAKLKRWNRMGRRTHIRVGQRLKIYTRGSGPSYASSGSSSGGQKAKYHTVRRGETLGTIARKYRTTSKKLMALNGIKNPKSLRAGKKIKVRAGTKARSKAGGTSEMVKYAVRPGDTPGTIALKFNMSAKELMRINGIKNPRNLRPGMKLKVRDSGKSVQPTTTETTAVALSDHEPALEEVAAETKVGKSTTVSKTYKVKSGETLGGIANRHGMSTKKLMAMNGIKDPKRVRAGTTLTVGTARVSKPAGKTTAVDLSTPKARTPAPKVSTTTYTVKGGETLGGIANRHGMSTKELMAINNIKDPRRVRAGSKLRVRGSAGTAATSKKIKGETTAVALSDAPINKTAAKSSSTTHTVKSGETLGHIAEKYGVSTKQLMAWNGIKNPRSVRAGRKLIVKGGKKSSVKKTSAVKTPGAPLKLAAAKKGGTTTYQVRSGETLWTIARKHNVTIAQLQKWNNLSDPSAVRAGTKLKIVKN